MKVVMVFVVSDGYTFSCVETVPFEYESCEAAAVEFERLVRSTKDDEFKHVFKFAGHEFNVYDFLSDDRYVGPDFFTVDEWFESCLP